MTATTEPRASSGVRPPRRRWDGASLGAAYFLILLIVPEGMVISKIPMNIQPVVALGLLLGLLWLGSQMVNTLGMGKGRTAVRLALFVYFSSHLVTYAIATRRGLLTDELRVADSSIIRISAMVGIGVFLCDSIRGWDGVERVVKMLVVGATVSALVGVLQFGLGLDLVAYFNVPGLRKLGVYDTIQIRNGFRRPAGTTNHPIEFGLVCAMAVPLTAHFLTQAHDLGRPVLRWWCCLVLVGAGSMVAVSRTAILCLVVALVVMVFFLPGRRKLTVPAIGIGFLAVAGAVVPGLLGTLYKLFANASDDPSVTGRTNDYPLVWAQIERFPWFGRGFGTYFPDRYILLDNQYLNTLVENGYVGVFAFIGLMLAATYSAWSARRLTTDPLQRSLAGALVAAVLVAAVGAVTFDLLAYALVTGLLIGSVGVCGAMLRAARDDRATAESRTSSIRPDATAYR